MQETTERVKSFLEKRFANVKSFNDGSFKINCQRLNREDLFQLDLIPATVKDIVIKRSGTGLVIIIT